jgi:hydrogenase maturation protein HypF
VPDKNLMVDELSGMRIHINGVVQGVGFRPFVYNLAAQLELAGWVRNTSAGVDIEVDGPRQRLQAFVEGLNEQAPPLARIDEVTVEEKPAGGFSEFQIVHSEPIEGAFQPISPDVSLCEDCLREMMDPQDRRYRYPFINCTNCGPRFTIIDDIPYDRPYTTMAEFDLCEACAEEYHDPLDRRFHAQPVACPECGPHIWLEADGQRLAEREGALQTARRMLKQGKVLAVKGLGGFHLACDATNRDAVETLRERKLRVDKPFAVMMPDLETVAEHCHMGEAERVQLQSLARPIVVLPRREGTDVVEGVSPGQGTLGVMLPYTPLHVLLLEKEQEFPPALVMTSGNMSEEPIAADNVEARTRLEPLADAFLMHNRGIRTRCDDSVVRVVREEVYPLRRSRGFSPFPVHLPWSGPAILAVGGELKNAFCLTRGRYAFLSQHIGDMENYETLRAFERSVAHFERLFRVEPKALAYDLHPEYMATRYALEQRRSRDIPAIGVQHHHAHVAACMTEHALSSDRRRIGVAFDGTGYGEDGAIWGGEFLWADYTAYDRPFHLRYVPLPGGDAAVKQPWRLALAWLMEAGVPWDQALPPVQASDEEARRTLHRMLEQQINTPLTSSVGRLFDAVAALIGLRQVVNYEAQAAMELEAIVDPDVRRGYDFSIGQDVLDPAPAIRAIVGDVREGVPLRKIAAKFHNGLAEAVLEVCRSMRDAYGSNEVVLSGGVWQNKVLLERSLDLLEEAGFDVFIHRQVPANDGGLALGQAAIAAHLVAVEDRTGQVVEVERTRSEEVRRLVEE